MQVKKKLEMAQSVSTNRFLIYNKNVFKLFSSLVNSLSNSISFQIISIID